LHAAERVLLLGDAAHAVSASAGQGCNSALQDVEVFGALLDQYEDDWTKVLPAYTLARLEDAHAVSDLSDYSSARSKWMKVEWFLRIILRKVLPKWLSSWGLRPMPMELLSETSLSYTDVLEQTKWWVDRVKRSQE
jgi:kynurenine 3-monooxygenase